MVTDDMVGCSSACEVTSYLSGGQNVPQISPSCTVPALSNKNEHELVLSLTKRLSMLSNCTSFC